MEARRKSDQRRAVVAAQTNLVNGGQLHNARARRAKKLTSARGSPSDNDCNAGSPPWAEEVDSAIRD
jgi:hypothetical protein